MYAFLSGDRSTGKELKWARVRGGGQGNNPIYTSTPHKDTGTASDTLILQRKEKDRWQSSMLQLGDRLWPWDITRGSKCPFKDELQVQGPAGA